MRVLVVEDEELMAEAIAAGLSHAGIACDTALDGSQALEAMDTVAYDVIVLDRDLPGIHGDDVCRIAIEEGYPARILMVTAASDIDARVEGLGLGADDYVPKPFALRELIARVEALARRVPARPPLPPGRGALEQREPIVRADLTIDPATRRVQRAGRRLDLTPKEYGTLLALAEADGAWLSAEDLLTTVWDANADPFTATVRITMARLRAKLGEPGLIETQRGVGYRLAADS